jgi:NAD(P)-dependent dehydrogenase (short-subunit alcohol dehydrogenase family)
MECGGKGRRSRCDIGDWEEVKGLGNEIDREWGGLDAVICCAGSQMPIGPAMTLDPPEWSRNIRQNLDGTYFTIRSVHRLLSRNNQRSKVICFSGGGATSPRENFSAYACAKTAIVRLVETLSVEWAGKPIDINAIAPGAINTAMTDEVIRLGPQTTGQKEYEQALKQKEFGGSALEKVGALVDFLLSRESDGISGKLLSAPWDSLDYLSANSVVLSQNDIFTLRRILPEDRPASPK